MPETERRYMPCRFEYTARVMWRVWDLRNQRYVETMRAEDGLTDFHTEGAAQTTADYLNARLGGLTCRPTPA